MGRKLLLDIPEKVYQSLDKMAETRGQSPEDVAIEWLVVATTYLDQDPVEEFIGALDSGGSDWADRHDQHLAQAARKKLTGSQTRDQASNA